MTRRLARSAQKGVMLLEALIGILIFSIGILAMVAMQAQSIAYVGDANYRSEAAFLANQLFAQMWVDRANLNTYVMPSGTAVALTPWLANLNGNLPGTAANPPTVQVNGTQVIITIFWQPPNATTVHNYVSIADISNP
jgi:type IV pilus assembly protein PilV